MYQLCSPQLATSCTSSKHFFCFGINHLNLPESLNPPEKSWCDEMCCACFVHMVGFRRQEQSATFCSLHVAQLQCDVHVYSYHHTSMYTWWQTVTVAATLSLTSRSFQTCVPVQDWTVPELCCLPHMTLSAAVHCRLLHWQSHRSC